MVDSSISASYEKVRNDYALYNRAVALGMPRDESLEDLMSDITDDTQARRYAGVLEAAVTYAIMWWLSTTSTSFNIVGGRVAFEQSNHSSGGYGFRNRPVGLKEACTDIIDRME